MYVCTHVLCRFTDCSSALWQRRRLCVPAQRYAHPTSDAAPREWVACTFRLVKTLARMARTIISWRLVEYDIMTIDYTSLRMELQSGPTLCFRHPMRPTVAVVYKQLFVVATSGWLMRLGHMLDREKYTHAHTGTQI